MKLRNNIWILFYLTFLLCFSTRGTDIDLSFLQQYSGKISVGLEQSIKNESIEFYEKYNFDRSTNVVFTLLLAIFYCILTMLIILPFILFNRNKMERQERTNQFLKEKYQELLIAFLYSDRESNKEVSKKLRKIATSGYSRQFLLNEIIDLSINLKGDPANQLRNLYLDMELDKLTYKKVKSRKWHVKIKAFRELAFMNLKTANKEILKALDSKNDILRMEAQIALVRLNERDPFHFLDYLDKPFTLWEQMNIHELILLHNIEVPPFVQWIDSPNKSVAQFAVHMVRVFKQEDAIDRITEKLDHQEPEMREAVISALGSLKLKKGLGPLRNHFYGEIYENKINILRALQKNTDVDNIPFLKDVLEKEEDVNIQVEAAKGIRDIGKEGEEELEKLIRSDEYRNYLIVLRHVLDKRI